MYIHTYTNSGLILIVAHVFLMHTYVVLQVLEGTTVEIPMKLMCTTTHSPLIVYHKVMVSS